jgi:multidrug resistance efflux pump
MTDTPAAAAAPSPGKRVLFTLVLVAIAAAGVLAVLYAWRLPPFHSTVERTDDAYVRGQVTVISPQVGGYVTRVAVQDYQTVQPGQLLATIDDRIYRARVDQALASLHSAEATLANSAQTRTSAQGSVAQTQAAIAGAQAQLARAQAEADRVTRLFRGGWVAQAQVDVTQAALRAARAQVAQAQAQRDIAETGVTTAVVGRGTLVAPRAGRLSEVTVRQGQSVTAGTQLMALVPDRIWIVANMKETQMKNVRVGQPAELAVDALDGQILRGHVEQIAPATGSEFSVIRPDNATGNFTKVAQRIPVRIALDPRQPLAQRLSPGMSVVARITTGEG